MLIFFDKEDSLWYGVALELNIVVSAESSTSTQKELQTSVKGYVEGLASMKGVKKQALETALNQEPDGEYLDMWKRAISDKEESIPDNYCNVSASKVDLGFIADAA